MRRAFHLKNQPVQLKVIYDPVDVRISVSNKRQVWYGGDSRFPIMMNTETTSEI